ncbi:MAG: hypothetical protein M3367_09800 [Acidobacteriota bacterium]|nr:hypothetical protein [Acidobacteriota bacterium]
MSENLTFRVFKEEDIPALIALWEENSDWGELSEEEFRRWFLNVPEGNCIIAVAENQNGKIIGQEVFTPSTIWVVGKEKKALRVSAPILAKEIRANMEQSVSPLLGMYKLGLQTAAERGYSILYSFPLRAWLILFKLSTKMGLGKVQTAEYDCYSLSLKSVSSRTFSAGKELHVSLLEEFNRDFDSLWESAKENFPVNCGIARNSERLQWKLKLGGDWVLQARSTDGNLIGYMAINKKTNLLVDMLARTPEDLENVFSAVVRTLCESEDLLKLTNLQEIKLVKTDIFANITEKFNFTKIDFKFAFCCYSLDDEITAQMVNPARWYMMPND